MRPSANPRHMRSHGAIQGTLPVILGIVLGAVFLAAGIMKLLHGAEFPGTLTNYRFLPEDFAGFVGLAVPGAEIALGLWLASGVLRRFAAGASLTVIIVFAGANVYSLVEGAQGGCGCLGDAVPLAHWQALILNGVMLGMALPLSIFRTKDSTGLIVSLRRNKALTAAGTACLLLALLTTILPQASPGALSSVAAADPGSEKGQAAPLNPAFQSAVKSRLQATGLPATGAAAARPLGLIPAPMDLSHLKQASAATPQSSRLQSPATLPASWDWRTPGKVTTVKDQ